MTITMNNEWPDTLPLPFIDHQGQARNTTLVGVIENGIIRRRSRGKKTYATLNATWKLSLAQFDAFQDYVANDLGNASAAFAIDLRYPSAKALITYAVRFTSEYQALSLEGIWQVTAQLDIIAPTLLPNSVLNQ